MVFCNNSLFTFSQNLWLVTILILIDGFLQFIDIIVLDTVLAVTILILIDGFLQFITLYIYSSCYMVTILILIDGFLQLTLLVTLGVF